ncbi:hypothetical protein [Cryobacterium algoricola]|uniref:hypothetical protein n=1 Tax=Cryobacterium algoricola TaxID=1259183 RepID=UPI001F53E651|nr:hypothetical protein [Cryobacterium algoricola]
MQQNQCRQSNSLQPTLAAPESARRNANPDAIHRDVVDDNGAGTDHRTFHDVDSIGHYGADSEEHSGSDNTVPGDVYARRNRGEIADHTAVAYCRPDIDDHVTAQLHTGGQDRVRPDDAPISDLSAHADIR